MNFKALQDEVIRLRFSEDRRASVKLWINLSYELIWDYADWPFKRVPGANLAVTSGDSTPAMPAEFAKAIRLYDDQGGTLAYLEPNEWERLAYPTPIATSGRADSFTVINRQIYLSPTPGGTATYRLSYKRRLSHVDAVLGIVGGVLSEDTDQPLWDAEWDYLLVLETQLFGQRLLLDPTSESLVPQRDELLARMKAALMPGVTEQVEQWGASSYGC